MLCFKAVRRKKDTDQQILHSPLRSHAQVRNAFEQQWFLEAVSSKSLADKHVNDRSAGDGLLQQQGKQARFPHQRMMPRVSVAPTNSQQWSATTAALGMSQHVQFTTCEGNGHDT